jgi:hypothetical protein
MPRRKRQTEKEIASELLRLARRAVDLADALANGPLWLRPGNPHATALADHILKPVIAFNRAIARLAAVSGAGLRNVARWEEEIAQLRAAIAEIETGLRPKPAGRKPVHARWKARFPRWQREIEGGAKLATILRREKVPEDDHASVRTNLSIWRRGEYKKQG